MFSTFLSKLPATLLLTGASILLTVVISIPLGILSAVKQNTFTDRLIRLCSFVGNSLPNFFVALLLMYLFSICDFQRRKYTERGAAGPDAGHRHVSEISPSGAGGGAG